MKKNVPYVVFFCWMPLSLVMAGCAVEVAPEPVVFAAPGVVVEPPEVVVAQPAAVVAEPEGSVVVDEGLLMAPPVTTDPYWVEPGVVIDPYWTAPEVVVGPDVLVGPGVVVDPFFPFGFGFAAFGPAPVLFAPPVVEAFRGPAFVDAVRPEPIFEGGRPLALDPRVDRFTAAPVHTAGKVNAARAGFNAERVNEANRVAAGGLERTGAAAHTAPRPAPAGAASRYRGYSSSYRNYSSYRGGYSSQGARYQGGGGYRSSGGREGGSRYR